jgi:ribosome recycling factor
MISAPDPKMLTVAPWDANNTQPILKGIRDSGLGLNPAEDSGVIRVPLPQITQERRNELIKLVNTKAEEKRIQIRNLRREVIESIDKDKQSLRSNELKKASAVSEDEARRIKDQIQKAVDSTMAGVDSVAKAKEAELHEI